MTYTLVVDYINNNSEASNIFSVGEKYNATDLDKPPLQIADLNIWHSDGLL